MPATKACQRSVSLDFLDRRSNIHIPCTLVRYVRFAVLLLSICDDGGGITYAPRPYRSSCQCHINGKAFLSPYSSR